MPDLHYTSIDASVGDSSLGAVNRDSDVRLVRGLLNVQIIYRNRSDDLLPVSGSVDSDLVRAIDEFQRCDGVDRTGLVEPGSRTLDDLRRFTGPSNMQASQTLIDWLKNEEGNLREMPYNDSRGNATIGYGHKLHDRGVNKKDRDKYPHGISDLSAERLLRHDLDAAEAAVNGHVRVPLTQNMFDALTSLTYNIGSGHFHGSSVLQTLNNGDYCAVPDAIRHLSGGGLGSRRNYEAALFGQR